MKRKGGRPDFVKPGLRRQLTVVSLGAGTRACAVTLQTLADEVIE
jgi:hypothetical protein